MNETYKVVRLKTGDVILCTIESDIAMTPSMTLLQIGSPLQVITVQDSRKGNSIMGESFILRPWMGMSDNSEFTINTDLVVTMGDMKPDIKQHYINYIEHSLDAAQQIFDAQERSNAADQLIRDVSGGDLNIIHEEDHEEENH